MAKTSQVLRDKRRKKLIKKHAAKRAELRKKLKDPNVSIEEKLEVQKAVREAAAQLLPDPAQAPLRDVGPLARLLPEVRRSRASRCATSR